MLTIIRAETTEKAYDAAAEAFASMWEKVTGTKPAIVSEDDGKSDLAVIGSDAVNDVTARFFAEDRIDTLSIRYGTDDYAICSVPLEGRSALVLAGGRGRSSLYAVYDYFERAAGCHYFWDGDVIPHHDTLPLDGFRVAESPRFEWRGLRYFAHRGLHRLQAEHWSLEDWKREIDWIVKRRLNFFMLRIGMDDLFQHAFPEEVSYPNAAEPMPESELFYAKGPRAPGYNDRTPFWPLEFRGILRKQVLAYARERDLIHSEDCGTMTHWYSRTPTDYLEAKKPVLLQQETRHYTEHANGVVWDPRVRENMKNYFRLTETEVRDWGSGQVLHTIGLAERDIFRDRKKNLNLKLFTYRRILQEIRERWPQAKILLATWDFVGYWRKDEIAALLKELNPENTLLLDYANDGNDPEHCLAGWDIQGKFPYTFGMFQSGESGSSIRGRYDLIAERLKASVEDAMCKGMVFWPEMSHSDILALEFLARNSWKPDQTDAERLAESLSRNRYGAYAGRMNEAWQHFLPMVKRLSWGHCTRKPDDPDYERYAGGERYANFLFNMLAYRSLRGIGEDQRRWMTWECSNQKEAYRNAEETLRALAQLPDEAFRDDFVYRDTVDIARSLLEQRIHNGIMALILWLHAWRQGADGTEAIEKQMAAIAENAQLHCALIGCHEDYSMHCTMVRMEETCPVNPSFEATLKRNLVNGYCRQAAYEPEKKLFLAEMEAYFAWVRQNLANGVRGEWEWTLDSTEDALYEAFMAAPLAELRPDCDRAALPGLLKRAAETVGKIRLDTQA